MDLVEKIKILNNYLQTKNFDKVIESGKKILNKIPQNDYLLNLIGMAYQGKSQYLNSIKFFEESIKQNPNNIAAMNNCANSLKALGDFESSKNLYEKILDRNPKTRKAVTIFQAMITNIKLSLY